VYGTVFPVFVETDFPSRLTEVTSSTIVSIPALGNHSDGRQRSLDASGMRAFESFVRSITKGDSVEITVIEPGYFSSRRVWTVPIVPLPLLVNQLICFL
jgi:hypothetical protein